MPKSKVVKQKFFKTAGGPDFDIGVSIVATKKCVYLTGTVSGDTGVDFTGKPIKTNLQGNDDIFVAGLDHCGKQKFFCTAGGPDNDSGFQVSATENGVFLTGRVQGETAIDFKGVPVPGLQGEFDIFVAGLDPCGTQKFFVTAGSTDTDFGSAIVANKKRVFVTGSIGGTTGKDFNGKDILTHPGGGDIFVAGLDHCGNQKFFVTAGGRVSDSGNSIALSKKSIFVTGLVNGETAINFKGGSVTGLQGQVDIFVAGLDHCGNQKFFVTAGGTLSDAGLSIVATENRVYVAGIVSGMTAIDFKGGCVTGLQGAGDIFVAGLDHCGNQKFFVTAGGANDDQGFSIDAIGNKVFVTGFATGLPVIGFDKKPVDKASSAEEVFVAGLDHCGKQKFFKTAGGSDGTINAQSIKATEKRVYVTGFIGGNAPVDFKGKVIPSFQGLTDIFVASLDHCGNQKYFVTAGGKNVDIGDSLDVVNNKVFVTGLVNGTTGTDFRGCPIKNLQGNQDIFVSRLDEDLPVPPLRTKMQYM